MAVQILSPELGFHSHTLLLGCAADGGCSGFFSGEVVFAANLVCFDAVQMRGANCGGVASFYGVRCGEDGDGAVLQKLRFVSGVVVFVVAAVAVQTVEARSRVAVLLMVAELVQPWLLREVQRT